MVRVRLGSDPEACTDKGCTGLGHTLLHGVMIITKALAQLTIEPVRRCGPVSGFMTEHAIPRLGSPAAITIEEARLVRHVDGVGRLAIAGLRATNDDGGARRGEVGFRGGDTVDRVWRQRRLLG